MADLVLDTCGKQCPIPVMKAAKAVLTVDIGQTLEVLATDPGAPEDMRVFCETKGHKFLEETFVDGVYRILIERAQ